MVNIYKDRAIVDAACCAADFELVGVHGGQFVHDVLQEKGKKDINVQVTRGCTFVCELIKHLQ